MAKKIKIKKANEVVTNSMKKCEFCTNGNCLDIGQRKTLNNFKDVSFCKKTLITIQDTKMTEDEIRKSNERS